MCQWLDLTNCPFLSFWKICHDPTVAERCYKHNREIRYVAFPDMLIKGAMRESFYEQENYKLIITNALIDLSFLWRDIIWRLFHLHTMITKETG